MTLFKRHGASEAANSKGHLQIWKKAANILNKQSRTANKW